MKVDKKELPKKQLELTFELTEEEFKPFVKEAAVEISKLTKIDGFRPGKAPYDVIVQKVGEMAIYQNASNPALTKSYYEYLEKENLEPVDQPEIEIKKLAPGNPFIFTATVTLLPEIELCDLTKIKQKPCTEIKIEDKEVDKVLDDLRKMKGKEVIKDGKAEDRNKVVLDFNTFMDNVPIENGQAKKHSLTIGEGYMIPGFEENLIGLKKDDEKEFELSFPKEYHEKKLADKKVTFKVKIHDIFTVDLPEMNDEMAKTLGLKDLAGLRGNIENNIKQEKEVKTKQKEELEIIDKLLEKSKIEDIPDVLINQELHKMMHELEDNVGRQGGKLDDYLKHLKKSESDMKIDMTPDAIKRVKTGLIIRQFAKEQNFKATEDDIKQEMEKAMASYKMNPSFADQLEELEKSMKTDNAKHYFKNSIINKKTLQYIKDQVIEKN